MRLEVSRLALETIATLRPLVPRIRRHDRSLAVQLVRAASSTVLNLGEGEYSDPGTKRARYCNAAGSANARARGAERGGSLGLPHSRTGGASHQSARSGHRHAVEAQPRVGTRLRVRLSDLARRRFPRASTRNIQLLVWVTKPNATRGV